MVAGIKDPFCGILCQTQPQAGMACWEGSWVAQREYSVDKSAHSYLLRPSDSQIYGSLFIRYRCDGVVRGGAGGPIFKSQRHLWEASARSVLTQVLRKDLVWFQSAYI